MKVRAKTGERNVNVSLGIDERLGGELGIGVFIGKGKIRRFITSCDPGIGAGVLPGESIIGQVKMVERGKITRQICIRGH